MRCVFSSPHTHPSRVSTVLPTPYPRHTQTAGAAPRHDDKVEVIRLRLASFHENRAAISQCYAHCTADIDGCGSIAHVRACVDGGTASRKGRKHCGAAEIGREVAGPITREYDTCRNQPDLSE